MGFIFAVIFFLYGWIFGPGDYYFCFVGSSSPLRTLLIGGLCDDARLYFCACSCIKHGYQDSILADHITHCVLMGCLSPVIHWRSMNCGNRGKQVNIGDAMSLVMPMIQRKEDALYKTVCLERNVRKLVIGASPPLIATPSCVCPLGLLLPVNCSSPFPHETVDKKKKRCNVGECK